MTAVDSVSLQLASNYVAAGRHREALRALSPHLASHPDDERALCLASQASLGLGEHERALSTAERAVAINPTDEWAWRLVASALAKLGRYAEAREAASVAQGLAPHSWLTHLSAAQVDVTARQITASGETAAREAVRLAPLEPDAHFMHGNVALALGHLSAAEASYRAVLRLNAHHTAARNNLAVAMLRDGREGDAAQGFLDVLASDPTFGLALRNVRVAARNAVSHIFRVFAVATSVTGYALVILLISSPLDTDGLALLHGCLAFIATVSAAVVATYLWHLRSAVGRHFFGYLRRMPRTDPYSTGFAALFVVVFALMTVACFESVPVSSGLYAACWILLLGSRAIPRRSIARP